MKEERIPFYILCFFGLVTVAYLEFCVVNAFLWAGFNGYGGIGMEYTSDAETIFGVILYAPTALILLMLVLRMIVRYKQGTAGIAAKYFFYDILFCAVAIGMGFFIFYFFKEPRQIITDAIIHAIRENGWLYYPAP